MSIVKSLELREVKAYWNFWVCLLLKYSLPLGNVRTDIVFWWSMAYSCHVLDLAVWLWMCIKWIIFISIVGFLISGFCFEDVVFQTQALSEKEESGSHSVFFLVNEFTLFWNLPSFCSRCLNLTWIYWQPLQEMGFGGNSEPGCLSCRCHLCTWQSLSQVSTRSGSWATTLPSCGLSRGQCVRGLYD